MKELHVAVGSMNDAKNEGVARAFTAAFGSEVSFARYEAASGIADQPTTDEESITGARNRAQAALASDADATYGVGLEGNVATTADTMFLHGWVVVVDRLGKIGVGQSASIELPSNLRNRIENGEELGVVVQSLQGDKENKIRHTLGTNGILTGGLYTREDEFEDATRCALAKFINPDLY